MSEPRILTCLRKPTAGAPMERMPALELRAGVGIVDDANGGVGSPRHVLLADDSTYRDFSLPGAALRENLLVTGFDLRDLRSGDLLQSDSGVSLRVTFPCEPCAQLNRVRPGLAREIRGRRGVLARVVVGGRLEAGEPLRRRPGTFPAIPEPTAERTLGVLRGVPPGRVTTLTHLTRMVGVSTSYVRVFPRILKAAPRDAPTHRIVRSGGGLLSRHLPGQVDRLREEGVEPVAEIVPPELVWNGDPYREQPVERNEANGTFDAFTGTCAAFGPHEPA